MVYVAAAVWAIPDPNVNTVADLDSEYHLSHSEEPERLGPCSVDTTESIRT
jgi:hypothetical protein